MRGIHQGRCKGSAKIRGAGQTGDNSESVAIVKSATVAIAVEPGKKAPAKIPSIHQPAKHVGTYLG